MVFKVLFNVVNVFEERVVKEKRRGGVGDIADIVDERSRLGDGFDLSFENFGGGGEIADFDIINLSCRLCNFKITARIK